MCLKTRTQLEARTCSLMRAKSNMFYCRIAQLVMIVAVVVPTIADCLLFSDGKLKLTFFTN